MKCACGSSDIVAIKPGLDALYLPGGLIPIEHAVADQFTCRACLMRTQRKESNMTQMTGKLALDAHNMLSAIEAAMKGRGEKAATADQFLTALHAKGYDVVAVASNGSLPYNKQDMNVNYRSGASSEAERESRPFIESLTRAD